MCCFLGFGDVEVLLEEGECFEEIFAGIVLLLVCFVVCLLVVADFPGLVLNVDVFSG